MDTALSPQSMGSPQFFHSAIRSSDQRKLRSVEGEAQT